MSTTIKEILKSSTEVLSNKLRCSNSSSRMDAEYCLMKVLKKDRVFLYMSENTELSKNKISQYNLLLKQRASGRPLAQILGTQQFYKSEFLIDNNVLIPRPETEILISEILKRGDELYKKQGSLVLIDAGTGTGCIGISLALERENWKIFLVENAFKSLNILNLNLQKFKLKNCNIIFSNWLSAFDNGSVDIVVSNPPYIDELANDIDGNVKKFEPTSALFAKDNGLSEINKIIVESKRVIKKTGLLLLENGYNQSRNVISMLRKNYYKDIKTILDYNGIKRFVVSRRS